MSKQGLLYGIGALAIAATLGLILGLNIANSPTIHTYTPAENFRKKEATEAVTGSYDSEATCYTTPSETAQQTPELPDLLESPAEEESPASESSETQDTPNVTPIKILQQLTNSNGTLEGIIEENGERKNITITPTKEGFAYSIDGQEQWRAELSGFDILEARLLNSGKLMIYGNKDGLAGKDHELRAYDLKGSQESPKSSGENGIFVEIGGIEYFIEQINFATPVPGFEQQFVGSDITTGFVYGNNPTFVIRQLCQSPNGKIEYRHAGQAAFNEVTYNKNGGGNLVNPVVYEGPLRIQSVTETGPLRDFKNSVEIEVAGELTPITFEFTGDLKGRIAGTPENRKRTFILGIDTSDSYASRFHLLD